MDMKMYKYLLKIKKSDGVTYNELNEMFGRVNAYRYIPYYDDVLALLIETYVSDSPSDSSKVFVVSKDGLEQMNIFIFNRRISIGTFIFCGITALATTLTFVFQRL